MKKSMNKILIAATFSLGLAGCGSLGNNTSMYSVHQPVVQRTNFAIDLAVDGDTIRADEQRRASEWLDALELGYGDRVSVDYGDGYASPAIDQSIGKMAADRGILMQQGAPVTGGKVAPGMVRVIVTRSKASVPSCPDWSSSGDANFNSSNHSNHGCSINSNMAAMIADPEDLLRGRENTKLDTNSGKNAVNTYRSKTGGN